MVFVVVKNGIGSRVTQAIIFVLGIYLLFTFLTSPLQPIKDQALFHLALLAVLAVPIYAGSTERAKERIIDWFDIKDSKDLSTQIGIGTIFGFVGLLLIAIVLQTIQSVQALGAVNYGLLASLTVDGAFFAAVVAPITEVFILVGGSLGLRNFLSSRKLPYAGIIAIIIVSLLFGGFHFFAKQQIAMQTGVPFPYETSLGGLLESITDVQGIGSPGYVGAFPQVILGMFWISIAFIYRSFIVAILAHLVSNSVVLFLSGPQNPEVTNILLLIFLVLFVAMIFAVKNGLLDKLGDISWRGFLSD